MISLKARLIVATLGALLLVPGVLQAQQVDPRGIPPPRRDSPDYPEREFEKVRGRKGPRGDSEARYRRLILEQIEKDFQKIQLVNERLGLQLTTNPLDYKPIAEMAGKIKSLASRLDSNLDLGKAENTIGARAAPEISDPFLKSQMVTLHGLVIRFVQNPVFRERGILDLEETRRAKADVLEIVFVSEEIKRIAKQLKRNVEK